MSRVFRLVGETPPSGRPASSAPPPAVEPGCDEAISARTAVPAVTVIGLRAVVASPHHLASDAGMRVLREGGSAVDAAIATNVVLSVLLPDMCGAGGDLFAMVWSRGDTEPAVLNASGTAGSGRSRAELAHRHPSGLPLHGWDSVVVPGAVAGWAELHRRFGRVPFERLFAEAVELATDGFPCAPRLAESIARQPVPLPDLTPADRPPAPGTRLRLPAYGRTLAEIGRGNAASFYRGLAAEELVCSTDGTITNRDLSRYRPEWVAPLHRQVWGVDLWAVPPNSQGYIALLAAEILERCSPPKNPDDPLLWHLMIEAIKAAARDRDAVLGDPRAGLPGAFEDADARAASIGDRAAPHVGFGAPGDTIYLAAVDGRGQGVSLIQSLYHPWGARAVLPRSGVLLQNRGASFSLREGHPNAYGPGRRPRSTLAPTLLSKAGELLGLIGTMGGDVQPQGVLQHLTRHLWCGLDPAQTLAYPRFFLHRGLAPSIWSGPPPVVGLERRVPNLIVGDLRRRGHEVQRGAAFSEGAGHAQMIVRATDGWAGAADPRAGVAGVAAW